MKRFLKPGWLIVYVIGIFILGRLIVGTGDYHLDTTVHLSEGETISSIYDDMGWKDALKLKRFMKQHNEEVVSIQPGSYVFSGAYSVDEILEVFLDGPQLVYDHITLLEGWNIYDVDQYLSDEGLIEKGEYVAFVQEEAIIDRYRKRYSFLQQAFKERDNIYSLEGYLYPDTYFIDSDKDTVDQLVYLQLEEFKTKIREPYGEQLLKLSTHLQSLSYNFSLSSYGALIVASIVEKEERIDANKPIITSIFYNRLDNGMQIDADISLCYGLQQGYETCTPRVIIDHLYDTTNPYNTRAVAGLPPTPIVSPTVGSITALFDAEPSNDFYYLHAPDGTLHTATDNIEHMKNKNIYLQ